MYQDFSITEHIPVSDHVYKYIVKRYGSDSFTATRNDIIGNLVLSSLSKNSDIKFSNTKFSKVINVRIKEYSYTRNGMFVSAKSGQVFNRMVDKLFRDELFIHVFMNKEDGKELVLKGIRKFLKIYNITEDDVKYESIYRDYKRKKNKITSAKVA